MTYVNYKEIRRANNTIVNTYTDRACYSKVFREVEKTTDALLLHTKTTDVNVELIQPWINEINKLGFPCEYLGYKTYETFAIHEEQHLFLIDITKYKYKDHLASTLSLIRYLFESGLGTIVINYFKVKEVYPRISILNALKISNLMFGYGSGHTLHRDPKFCSYDKKSLLKKLKSKHTIRTVASTKLHEKWASEKCTEFTGVDFKNIKQIKKKMEQKHNLVYVVGGENVYANWLPNFKITKKIEEAELVMFTGGEDVDPSLYNEPRHQFTYTNLNRDLKEKEIFEKAKRLRIKMIGICRGAQFLCVMNGGKLVQHQDNPAYIHEIETKYGSMKITSTHHQAQHPYNLSSWEYNIIGWTKGLSSFHLDGNNKEMNPMKECEIVHYSNNDCLAIQGHPEHTEWQMYNPESLKTLLKIFNDFFKNRL